MRAYELMRMYNVQWLNVLLRNAYTLLIPFSSPFLKITWISSLHLGIFQFGFVIRLNTAHSTLSSPIFQAMEREIPFRNYVPCVQRDEYASKKTIDFRFSRFSFFFFIFFKSQPKIWLDFVIAVSFLLMMKIWTLKMSES